MPVSRRRFLAASIGLGMSPHLPAEVRLRRETPWSVVQDRPAPDRFDPWIEVSTENLRFNARQVARLAGNRPILAVVKNNAYGLGLTETAEVLESMPEIAGFAVVKAGSAVALRDAGIEKPVLLMGMCTQAEGRELIARDVELSLYTDDAARRIGALAAASDRPVRAHFYLDTGLGRMGMPHHRAVEWMASLDERADLQVAGTFMAFTEETDFDREQLQRFTGVLEQARAAGIEVGRVHAASSNGVFHLPGARFDAVRPGIALFGAYPSRPDEERQIAELRCAVRLRARVVRVVRLRRGDGAGYGRAYVAERPTWLATLPAGHVDGVPRQSAGGARVLIGERTFPIVGSVSASHCLVELGDARLADVGDVATIVGPDHPDLEPNAIARRTGVSVYDVMMHLDPTLPRAVV